MMTICFSITKVNIQYVCFDKKLFLILIVFVLGFTKKNSNDQYVLTIYYLTGIVLNILTYFFSLNSPRNLQGRWIPILQMRKLKT